MFFFDAMEGKRPAEQRVIFFRTADINELARFCVGRDVFGSKNEFKVSWRDLLVVKDPTFLLDRHVTFYYNINYDIIYARAGVVQR